MFLSLPPAKEESTQETKQLVLQYITFRTTFPPSQALSELSRVGIVMPAIRRKLTGMDSRESKPLSGAQIAKSPSVFLTAFVRTIRYSNTKLYCYLMQVMRTTVTQTVNKHYHVWIVLLCTTLYWHYHIKYNSDNHIFWNCISFSFHFVTLIWIVLPVHNV